MNTTTTIARSVTLPVKALKANLSAICKTALARSPHLPALECVHIEPLGHGTRWTVTNLDQWASFELEGESFGPADIPARQLLKLLGKREVTMSFRDDGDVLIQSGGIPVRFPCLPVGCWVPEPELGPVEHTLERDAAVFRRMARVLSTDETRYTITGFQLIDGHLYATNGRAMLRLEGGAGSADSHILQPGFLGGIEGKVRIELTGKGPISEQQYSITTGDNKRVVAKLIDGPPPRCEDVCTGLRESGWFSIPLGDLRERVSALPPQLFVGVDFEHGRLSFTGRIDRHAPVPRNTPAAPESFVMEGDWGGAPAHPECNVRTGLLAMALSAFDGPRVEVRVNWTRVEHGKGRAPSGFGSLAVRQGDLFGIVVGARFDN